MPCLKWLNRIGPYRFCSIASDDAGNTKKGRRLVHTQYPHLIDLPDACHNLHNLCKDICNLPFFKAVSALLQYSLIGKLMASLQVIAQLRGLLAFLSLSTYTMDHLEAALSVLLITRTIQFIGETRFGTIYWSIESVLRCFPGFERIVQEQCSNQIESEVSPNSVS